MTTAVHSELDCFTAFTDICICMPCRLLEVAYVCYRISNHEITNALNAIPNLQASVPDNGTVSASLPSEAIL